MYVYLTETKAVHSSAFPALFYLTLVLFTILMGSTLGYGGDRAYVHSKQVFTFTSLFVPTIVKAVQGPGNKVTHSLDLLTAIRGC